MTTTDTLPPPRPVEAIRARLSVIVGRPELRHRKLGRADPATLALALPHGVYSLDVDELARAVPIQEARRVAEEFVVLSRSTMIAIAEVSPRGHVAISEGPAVDGLRRAIKLVDADRDSDDTDVEVRVLRVPEVNLLALWLRHSDGRGDQLVPAAPTPANVRAYRRYSAAELTEVLVRVGRRYSRSES